MILSAREQLYEHLTCFNYSTYVKVYKREKDFSINGLLAQLQSFNLLCDNEVQYYNQQEYSEKMPQEMYDEIQTRVLYHRAEESSIKNSIIKRGGFISIANGSRVQGTTHVNGLQPDYIVDTASKEIQGFIKAISTLKTDNLSVVGKIDKVGEILRKDFILKTEYEDPVYLQLLKKYKDSGLEVPLSEYLKIKRGVCREISMLTSIALNSLGVESYYYYAKVRTSFEGIVKEEDHAIVPVSINGEFLISDNYFRMFDKEKLSNLETPEGVQCLSGLMYDDASLSKKGEAHVFMSRLYPETRHNSRHIK